MPSVPISHAPEGYYCNFCRIGRLEAFAGLEGIHTTNEQVVLHDDDVTVFVASHWWPSNPGAVSRSPTSTGRTSTRSRRRLGEPILRASQRVALAMKTAFGCDGVSTRQHNEPAGNQDMWHFHQHVFPRFHGDDLLRAPQGASAGAGADREAAASRLREAMGT